MADKQSTSGIENTARRDPLLHLMGALGDSDSYITGMEAAGQQQLVNSTMLPTKVNSGSDDDLRALGFQLGDPDPNDKLFRPVTLPEGWSKQRTDHSMWSRVFDQHGRPRLTVFYKAAFYDRDAFINVQTVRGYADDLMNGIAPLYLDEWATADALRAALEKTIADDQAYIDDGFDDDGFWAGRVAKAREVLALLPGGDE
jgi:hypothetical protein